MSIFAGTDFYQAPKCDRCGLLESDCKCEPEEVPRTFVDPAKQKAQIRKEKRAKGKMVTVVRGLLADENDFAALLKQLKNVCGAGGCIEQDTLEIQGDHRERIADVLKKIGYKTQVG